MNNRLVCIVVVRLLGVVADRSADWRMMAGWWCGVVVVGWGEEEAKPTSLLQTSLFLF